jgi:hypothetical protein
MASALGMKAINQAVDAEDNISITYEVLVVSLPAVRETMSVTFAVSPSVTPQQFRTAFSAAIVEQAQVIFGVTLSANDCLIDQMQRG